MQTLDIDLPAGRQMHDFVSELFPICRSLTGDGVRQTLEIIRKHLPGLQVHEVPSGTRAYDWVVPDEWNIRSARLTGPDGSTVVDFKESNLHVVGYSEPVDRELSLEELQPHLYSLPNQPDATPYITSYYKRHWGFCLPHNVRQRLQPGTYRAVIDATLAPGHLTYGEIILPGDSDPSGQEVLLSTCICHPSMANNELSGPAVATWLAKWLQGKPHRHTYRIVFIPETIGAIVYLSRNLAQMKGRTLAGFNLTCMGDERCFSFMPSRKGDTAADRVARHVLRHCAPDHKVYTFQDRGSDERQYCSPGVDLPMCLVVRSKYFEFPEYHTSLDDLTLVTPAGLGGSLAMLRLCLDCLEHNETLRTTVLCEPQLGRRDLYPSVSRANNLDAASLHMIDILAYSDGDHDLLTIAENVGAPLWTLLDTVDRLKAHGLLR